MGLIKYYIPDLKDIGGHYETFIIANNKAAARTKAHKFLSTFCNRLKLEDSYVFDMEEIKKVKDIKKEEK